MSSASNFGSGNGGGGNKKGKGTSNHPVHTASSWRKNDNDTSGEAENIKQPVNPAAPINTTTPLTKTQAPANNLPRAPLPTINFPPGCVAKFTDLSAEYGRNQARRELQRRARERPNAWNTDLIKPIVLDAENRRGPFLKSAREQGRDNEIYRWGELNENQLASIANDPDEG